MLGPQIKFIYKMKSFRIIKIVIKTLKSISYKTIKLSLTKICEKHFREDLEREVILLILLT